MRLIRDWVSSIGLGPSAYGTHLMRRTKVAQIYRKTGNLRAVQLLLGHTKMDSTVRWRTIKYEEVHRGETTGISTMMAKRLFSRHPAAVKVRQNGRIVSVAIKNASGAGTQADRPAPARPAR